MLKLLVLEEKLSICRVENSQNVINFIVNSTFFNVTKASSYLSVICETRFAKEAIWKDDGWKALKIESNNRELLASNEEILEMIYKLKDYKIKVMIASTYDGEYVLVKEENLELVRDKLEKIGECVV